MGSMQAEPGDVSTPDVSAPAAEQKYRKTRKDTQRLGKVG